jgi:hypothetical protein
MLSDIGHEAFLIGFATPSFGSILRNNFPKVDVALLVQIIISHTLRGSLVWKEARDGPELLWSRRELVQEYILLLRTPITNASIRGVIFEGV